MPYEFSPAAEERARKAFQQVLDDAAPSHDLGRLKLFTDGPGGEPSEAELFIRKEVERKLFEPTLPNGGSKERRIIEKLKALALDREWVGSRRAGDCARAWEAVLASDPRNPGRYYVRRAMTPKDREWEEIRKMRDLADEQGQWRRKWFWQMLLDGLPEPVSNFKLECLFLLRSKDGHVTRLVRLKNCLGETSMGNNIGGSEIMDEDAFCSPEKFRKWCLGRGNFNWSGNQTALHKLHEDISREAAWRVVNRVDSMGWHAQKETAEKKTGAKETLAGMWFFDDCAIVDGGKVLPDEQGIMWWNGEGYYLWSKGRETNFGLGRPKMRPGVPGTATPEFFREVCGKFFDTLGGYEGFLGIGAMLAYGAAPEIFDRYGLFPGLFIHGQMESGKTLDMEWLTHMWGFDRSSGIGLLKGTAVGLLCDCENYSNLPLWADEYRQGKVSEEKEAILRDCYNRQPPVKWSADGAQREMKTAFVITGESTSSDAAMRSRFPHIQASKDKRLANHLEWMQTNKKRFYVIARTVLERREEFVKHLFELLHDWVSAPDLAGVNEREKFVHGIVWAAWSAFANMLGSHTAEDNAKFLVFMIEHTKGSALDVTSETNINVFFSDMMTAFKAGEIPLDCFRHKGEYRDHPPGADQKNDQGQYTQRGWTSETLFLDPDALLSHVQIFLRKQNSSVALKRKDLRDQLSKCDFWVAPNPRGSDGKIRKLQMRFGSGAASTPCWGIKLDSHPMGYTHASDEEVDYYLRHKDEGEGDPRKGPLYQIIERLEDTERAAQ